MILSIRRFNLLEFLITNLYEHEAYFLSILVDCTFAAQYILNRKGIFVIWKCFIWKIPKPKHRKMKQKTLPTFQLNRKKQREKLTAASKINCSHWLAINSYANVANRIINATRNWVDSNHLNKMLQCYSVSFWWCLQS